MPTYSEDEIRDLIEGKLSWEMLKRMMSSPKDSDRFETYVAVLQKRVSWQDRILLPLAEHLYIVQKGESRVVKCDCGHEFGDYRQNWKLEALINVRDTDAKLGEVYIGPRVGENGGSRRTELREYYCPGCGLQLEVEAVPPGYHALFDFLPDLDAFYARWLEKPLPSGTEKEWFVDKTYEVTSEWANELKSSK